MLSCAQCTKAELSYLVMQGGNPYVTPDSTVHDPKAPQNGDVELGAHKPVTAPNQQKTGL